MVSATPVPVLAASLAAATASDALLAAVVLFFPAVEVTELGLFPAAIGSGAAGPGPEMVIGEDPDPAEA